MQCSRCFSISRISTRWGCENILILPAIFLDLRRSWLCSLSSFISHSLRIEPSPGQHISEVLEVQGHWSIIVMSYLYHSNNTNHNQHLIILFWALGIPNFRIFIFSIMWSFMFVCISNHIVFRIFLVFCQKNLYLRILLFDYLQFPLTAYFFSNQFSFWDNL